MGLISRFHRFYINNRDGVRLGAAVVIMTITGLFIVRMLSRALVRSPLRATAWEFLPGGFTPVTLSAILFGIYLGLIALLYIDHKKRAQAVILLFVTTLGVVVLFLDRRFVAFFGFAEAILTFISAAGSFLWFGRGQLGHIHVQDAPRLFRGSILEGRGQSPVEFPDAERALFFLMLFVIVGAFWEAHTQYPQPFFIDNGIPKYSINLFTDFRWVDLGGRTFAVDIASAGIFLGVFYLFLGYDAERTIFVVGPSGSGKTHFVIGLNLKAVELGKRCRNSSDKLNELKARLADIGDFIEQRTRYPQDLSFEFTSGKYFPKNIELNAIDYPGEYLAHIPVGIDYDDGKMAESTFEERIIEQRDSGAARKDIDTGTTADGGGVAQTTGTTPEASSATGSPSTVIDVNEDDDEIDIRARSLEEEVIPALKDADTLIFVLDMAKFLDDQSLDANYFNDVLTRLGDKETVLVASKADLLADDFRDEYGLDVHGHYDKFRRYIANRLANHPDVGQLLEATRDDPYPVFYETYETTDGARKMEIGPARQPTLYGYRQVVERLGR